MSEERRDNDRQVEELKQEASEIERKVCFCPSSWTGCYQGTYTDLVLVCADE